MPLPGHAGGRRMKRRSRAGGKPVKALPRKALKLKGRKASKAVPRRGSAPADPMAVARLTHELNESLEREAAIAEVLQIINSSPGDLAPVFDALLDKAMRLCEAIFGSLTSYDGERFHTLALRGLAPEAAEAFREPWTAGPGTYHENLVRGESLVHTDLNLNDEVRRAHPQSRAVIDSGARTLLLIALR